MQPKDIANAVLGKKEGFQSIYTDTEKIQRQTAQIKKARHEIENIMNNLEI